MRRDRRLDQEEGKTLSRRAQHLLPLVVGAIAIAAFLPALRAGFVSWDDERNFLTNPHYRGLGLDQLRWMWSTFLLGHYVPLSWMTLGLDYTLWGMDARGYHATNLAIHAANAVLLYFVARRVLGAALPAIRDARPGDIAIASAFAALAFAVHPLRVESVAWITERRDVLSGFFGLATVLWYLRYLDDVERKTSYWIAVAVFVCALLSKGTSVTIPAVLLVLNVHPARRLGGAAGWWSASARRVYAEMVPFAVPAAAVSVLSIVALHPPEQLSLGGKLAVSAYSLVFYLEKTFLPARLSPLYGLPNEVDPFAARFVASYVALVAIVAAAWFVRRRLPGAIGALIAFLAISLPMLGVVQNGPQIAADRYTYHAAPALAILAGAGLAMLMRRWSARGAITLGASIVMVLAVLTWRQTGVWHDSRTLWSRVLEIEPESPLGHSAWANILYGQNRVEEAMDHSARAVAAAPGFAEGHNDLGVGFAKVGRFPEAVSRYQEALALKPGFDEAEANWGVVLAQQGQLDSAIAHFRRALAANPDNANAEVNWGNALVRGGREDEAIEHYRRALWIRPDLADAELNWGVALARQGRYAEAITHFQRTLQLDPAHAEAREYLARARQLLQGPPAPR